MSLGARLCAARSASQPASPPGRVEGLAVRFGQRFRSICVVLVEISVLASGAGVASVRSPPIKAATRRGGRNQARRVIKRIDGAGSLAGSVANPPPGLDQESRPSDSVRESSHGSS